MNCNEASALAVAYADGEVEGARADAVKEHLSTCADCAAACEAVRTLRSRLRAEIPVYRASPALRARVLAAATAGAPAASSRVPSLVAIRGSAAGSGS